MSQHDYNIANQTSINFRADLNNALVSSATNNSGITEPSATYPTMFWYATPSSTLKIRDETNSRWEDLFYVDQDSGVFPYIGTTKVTAFLDEDDLDSNSATAIPSQQSVKTYVDNRLDALSFPSLGEGQAWQDVRSSRTAATAYQNTENRAIQVSITGSSNSGDDLNLIVQVRKNNQVVDWITVGRVHSDNADMAGTVTVVVPPNHFYRVVVEEGILASWAELREDIE